MQGVREKAGQGRMKGSRSAPSSPRAFALSPVEKLSDEIIHLIEREEEREREREKIEGEREREREKEREMRERERV